MKLNCNVVKDLLPLYHDGVCSQESQALVEEHLKGCEDCRAELRSLRGEIEVPHEAPDDLGALKTLGSSVKRIRWICAALAAVLVLTAAVSGWDLLEKRRYQAKYQPFFDGQEAVVLLENEESIYETLYDWGRGNYRFQVKVPRLGNDGLITVEEFSLTKDIPTAQDRTELTMYIRFDGDGYLYDIAIEYPDDPGAHRWDTITLTPNGVTVDDPDWDQETLDYQNALVETYAARIRNLIMAAEREWPFLAE